MESIRAGKSGEVTDLIKLQIETMEFHLRCKKEGWIGEAVDCGDDGYTMAEVKAANFNKSCIYKSDPLGKAGRVVAFFRNFEV